MYYMQKPNLIVRLEGEQNAVVPLIMGSVPKNFRLSREAVEILNKIATELGVTQTDVLETCIARHAAETGIEVERARELLLTQIAKATSSRKKKPTVS